MPGLHKHDLCLVLTHINKALECHCSSHSRISNMNACFEIPSYQFMSSEQQVILVKRYQQAGEDVQDVVLLPAPLY